MEKLLVNLIEHISKNMPQISLIDEDYGQLEALDNEAKDMYPLTYPAVLIDINSCQWKNLSEFTQEGIANIRIRLIIDCYDDTHYHSNTTDRIYHREEIRKALHRAIQGFRPLNDGSMIRTESQFFTFNHGIKVYESSYTCRVYESTQERASIHKRHVLMNVSAHIENLNNDSSE